MQTADNEVWLKFTDPRQDPGLSIALLFRHKLTALLPASSPAGGQAPERESPDTLADPSWTD